MRRLAFVLVKVWVLAELLLVLQVLVDVLDVLHLLLLHVVCLDLQVSQMQLLLPDVVATSADHLRHRQDVLFKLERAVVLYERSHYVSKVG